MSDLHFSKVYRGGATAQYLNVETSEITFHVNLNTKSVDFRFKLASKGGGTTSVLLQVDIDDLSRVLEYVAGSFPDQVDVFSECATIANKKIREKMQEAQRVQKDEKARAIGLIEKLESVEEFVTEKYYQAPSENDKKEAMVKNELEEVIQLLRDLST
jgi:hypothetical protein